jgi:membrane protein implicated in regulation of membrane protease activity
VLPTTERGIVILVGAVLLALGLIFNVYLLWVVGVVVLVVGAVFWLLGATGRQIAGRRYWY